MYLFNKYFNELVVYQNSETFVVKCSACISLYIYIYIRLKTSFCLYETYVLEFSKSHFPNKSFTCP